MPKRFATVEWSQRARSRFTCGRPRLTTSARRRQRVTFTTGTLLLAAALMTSACAGPRVHPVAAGAAAYRHGAYGTAAAAWSRALELDLRAPRVRIRDAPPIGGTAVLPGPGTPPGSPGAALPRVVVSPDTAAMPTSSPSVRTRIDGLVEELGPHSALVRVAPDRAVAVDLSEMNLPARTMFLPGRPIAVWGEWTGTALVAHGIAVDYGG